jgi:hypothetical protein
MSTPFNTPLPPVIEFGIREERQLLDLAVRFPHTLARMDSAWKVQLGFNKKNDSLFPSIEAKLLVDSILFYFERVRVSGGSIPTYYNFPNGDVLTECLYSYASEHPTEFLDPVNCVNAALNIYASPSVNVGEADGSRHIQNLWRPYIIAKAHLAMAARIQSREPCDLSKVTKALDAIKGGDEEILFESSREMFTTATEENLIKFPVGFTPLDAAFDGGLDRDANILLFGNNGSGKSTIANQMAIWMAENVFRQRNEMVLHISSEQPCKQHFRSAMSCFLQLQKGVVARHLQNPATFDRYLSTIVQTDVRENLRRRLSAFVDVTQDTLVYLRYPKKGAINISDWLPIKIAELQHKYGKKVGAVFADWFGRTFCGKPDESRLVGEMNITADNLTTMMDGDGGFNAILVVLAQAVAGGYGSASLKATDIGNAKNITDSFETVMGITSMMSPPAVNEEGELLAGDRKRYRDVQLLNIVKNRFSEPCDIPFRRDYARSRILPVDART